MNHLANWFFAGAFLFISESTLAAEAPGSSGPAHLERTTLSDREFLDQFIGDWKVRGTSNGKPVDWLMIGDRSPEGGYLRLVIRDTKPSQYFQTTVNIVGPLDHQFRVQWEDDSRFGLGGAAGLGKRDDESFMIELPATTGGYRETFTYEPASRSWHWQSQYYARDGKWTTAANYTIEKR